MTNERQLGSEREIALMEGHRIPAVDAYFRARPSLDGPDERKCYEAGYQRGWRDSNAAHPAPMAEPLPDDLRRFLDVAAGEGFVLDGVDAGDLFLRLFPDAFKDAPAPIPCAA
jgi:hypothetical protein